MWSRSEAAKRVMLRAAVEQNGVVLLITCNPTDTDLVYNACEGRKAGEGRQGRDGRYMVLDMGSVAKKCVTRVFQ